MVLDTSAIIAAVANERDSFRYREAMLGAERLVISSVTVLETRIVLLVRFGNGAVDSFDGLLRLLSCHSMRRWRQPHSQRSADLAKDKGTLPS
jgi:uncharacterized protein with PIN domain